MADAPDDSQISRLAVERQLVTADEIRSAAEHQRQQAGLGQNRALGEVLVDLGFVTRTQLNRLQGVNDDSGGRPAQQIPGYQLIKKIGAGAMAVVYKGRQISLNRIVAVKVLPRRLSKNQEFVERFYREGRAAAALNHNNIVQAIDVGEANSFHYFVMEYVEGFTVYDELAQGKVYDEADAVNLVTQVAQALQHAHERGIIHRDVKPKNIMMTKDRVAKLADMGLAREASDVQAAMAEAGRAYGTPYYISPEQIRGELDIDNRADLYSLGATWYHMVTGRVPFEGPTPSAVMHKHLKEPLVPPDHVNQRLSAGCGAMIEMLMSKDRERRYSSAKEVLADLALLARGQPPQFAQQYLGHDDWQKLSTGDALEEGEDEATFDRGRRRAAQPQGGSGMLVLAIVLGVVAAVSVFLNFVLFATR